MMFTQSIGRLKSKWARTENLTKWTIAAALYIVLWSVVFFIAWCLTGNEPATLETCILAPGVVELVMSAVIKLGKNSDKLYKKLFDLIKSGNVDEALTVLQTEVEDDTDGQETDS